MASFEENIETLKGLVKILDEVSSKTDATAGLYLKNLSAKITKLRDEIQQHIDEAQQGLASQSSSSSSNAGQTTVFISLFQADPESIAKWERTLKRIAEYSLSRPIYRKVDHVQQMIRTRPDPRKEAYAVVSVNESDIIRGYAGKSEKDVNGNELLTVKEGALKPQNIQQFIHGDQLYFFKEDRLVAEQTNDNSG